MTINKIFINRVTLQDRDTSISHKLTLVNAVISNKHYYIALASGLGLVKPNPI